MPYEKYDKGTGRGTNQPRISLRRSSTIGIDDPAITESFVDVDGVVLYQADEAGPVGLEAAAANAGVSVVGVAVAAYLLHRYQLVALGLVASASDGESG